MHPQPQLQHHQPCQHHQQQQAPLKQAPVLQVPPPPPPHPLPQGLRAQQQQHFPATVQLNSLAAWLREHKAATMPKGATMPLLAV